MMAHSHDDHSRTPCYGVVHNSGVQQSIDEMEFERGIWSAAQSGDLDRVQQLLRKGVSANVEDSAGYRALHYAARNAHYRVCEMLLKCGADVNARTRCGNTTALHRAATQGHADIVALLMQYCADVNLMDVDGNTALHRALVLCKISVGRLLIPCADLTVVDGSGRSAEDLAVKYCKELMPVILTYAKKEQEKD